MHYRLFAIAALMLGGAFVSLYEAPFRPAPPEVITTARETVIEKNSQFPQFSGRGLVATHPVKRDYTQGQWI